MAKNPQSTFEVVVPGTADQASRQRARRLLGLPESGSNAAVGSPTGELEQTADGYVVDEKLATAVNMALCVKAPLLITGEPGTGKTQAAYYLHRLLGVPLFRFQTRSTSTANDLRYDFDAVAYLRYANLQTGAEEKRERFLRPRALWLAYECPTTSIVLIDEVDKAPRDFPNDLLREIEEHRFTHPFDETLEVKPKASRPPIIVATSNAERRLPDAFLRRCIVHHLSLTPAFIDKVVAARLGAFPKLPAAVRTKAVERFLEIRSLGPDLSRTPSTAELLVWLAVLAANEADETSLGGPLDTLPGIEALVKDHQDFEVLKNRQR